MILSGTDPRLRRKRINKRKRAYDRNVEKAVIARSMVVGLLVLVYCFFLYRTENVLDNALHKASMGPDDKFLIFENQLLGQGNGNVVSGLLAAHLLGQEFNRTVCVQNYDDFTMAFDFIDLDVIAKCPTILNNLPKRTGKNTMFLLNFFSPPNECDLQQKLASSRQVFFLAANTYPRWPKVPDNFFFQFYQPKQALLDTLPYDEQPTTVVHLREPDSIVLDPRKGLDEKSLTALGEMLPMGDTFLVTNRVAYYDRFEKCCRWTHPNWDAVMHSATGMRWDENNNSKHIMKDDDDDKVEEINSQDISGLQNLNATYRREQNLRLWSDWWTVLMAKTVYHTSSDFSTSAVHWMNNHDSHAIEGMNDDGTLNTIGESFWRDGETAPLIERTRDAEGTSQLRLCDQRVDESESMVFEWPSL